MSPAYGLGGSRATIKIKAPQKNRAKFVKQKGKKEKGLGECPERKPLASDGVKIFTLLRLRIEYFRFSLIKRKPKQKNFLFLLPARRSLGAGEKEKIAREKNKKCRENFSVLVLLKPRNGVRDKLRGGKRKCTSLFRILFKKC